MLKRISVLVLICLLAVAALAQSEKSGTPIKWETYKVGEQDVSILFPKLPILVKSFNSCSEQETNKYAAYAGGVAYGLNINYKSKQNIPEYCTEKRKFDENSFESGLKGVKAFLKTEQETKVEINNQKFVKIKGNRFTYWLLDDFENKRWFEFWISEEDKENEITKNFVESLRTEKSPSGIEIGSGASATLGDVPTAESSKEDKAVNSEKDEAAPLRLIVKPPPGYTDVARQAQIQGTVRLRVTFLASGSIGSVEILNALPYGLTEQAVAAVRKIVFIPQKKMNTKVAVTKTVEYSFSIY